MPEMLKLKTGLLIKEKDKQQCIMNLEDINNAELMLLMLRAVMDSVLEKFTPMLYFSK